MNFNMDFSNDKPDIRLPIPAGTPLFLQMTFTPGGVGPGGALTASKDTDAVYLKSEFTVLSGPFKGRKFWGNLTVAGGKVDEKGESKAGKITRQTIRCIIDSSLGLASNDESADANAKRVLKNGFGDLYGRRFVAKAKIEKAQNGYAEKNGLGQVLTIDMKGYPTPEELENPAIATTAPATPPAPPPAWNNAPQTAQPVTPAEAAQAPLTPPTQTTAAPAAPVAPAQPATSADNGVPAWAKAAA